MSSPLSIRRAPTDPYRSAMPRSAACIDQSMRTLVLNSPSDLTTWPLLSQTEITK